MTISNEKNIIHSLDQLIESWQTQFENKLPVSIQFSVDGEGTLLLNNIPLCPAKKINEDSLTFDVEFLYIGLVDGSFYEIHIASTFDGPCTIDYIHHIIPVYSADSSDSAEK